MMARGTAIDPRRLRLRMVRELAARGITDGRVLDAMSRVPRHLFVPEGLRSRAYEDCPLPIGYGQTISQPSTVALMSQMLETSPGMRVLDKMAVKIGGGENHRMGLFDMILLKDNHIDFAGGIRPAIEGVRRYLAAKGKTIPIECEVRTLEDIDEVFAAGGVDRIMFDNFTPEMTRRAVEKVAGRCETESSGGITLDTMRDYAECGVDFISVGALTHQIKSLDMSLKACE